MFFKREERFLKSRRLEHGLAQGCSCELGAHHGACFHLLSACWKLDFLSYLKSCLLIDLSSILTNILYNVAKRKITAWSKLNWFISKHWCVEMREDVRGWKPHTREDHSCINQHFSTLTFPRNYFVTGHLEV